MKHTAKLFLGICFWIFALAVDAQPAGEWMWIHGSNVANSSGNYGVQGIPSPTNDPPAAYEPSEWADLNGNFWLCESNVLWKYDPITNEWTWMKGNPSDTGSYGIQGIPSPSNVPSRRVTCSASWTDLNNNLWLFGGQGPGVGSLNDLWKYDISTNEWVWMKGSNTGNALGVYGTLGVPDTANTPGGRWETSAAWTDNSNNLWLFGGYEINHGYFNDLWRYNISTNTWTWMKGSQNVNQVSVYGIKGVESPSNTPGARQAYARWKDNNGNLWLFGGYIINDVWRYNTATNNWTWMAGDSTYLTTGVYGIKCIYSDINKPGARFENRASYVDANGNFWTFGGTNANSFARVWNDLWYYNVTTNQWIWESGDSVSNSIGNWGVQGVPSPANKPNGRAGAVGWTDNNGHLYLFGGATTGFSTRYNDLWKFTIDHECEIVSNVSSIQNIKSEITIYPNPTKSILTLATSSTNPLLGIIIYGTDGRKLREEILSSKSAKVELDLSGLAAGVYFLDCAGQEGREMVKVVKY